MASLRPWFPVATLLVTCVAMMAFEIPDKAQRTSAAGSLLSLSPKLRRAFSDGGEFNPKREPGGLDWLGQHGEPGQTYDQYLASRPNMPGSSRKKLYILPMGKFDKGTAPDLQKLKTYTAAYYHPMAVEMLPGVHDGVVPAKERLNMGKKQWKSEDILDWLPEKLPADAYAMIAVTMTDLYPNEKWNFVFGQASIKQRVGVFSFARYHPAWSGDKAGAGTEQLVLRRAAKILTHEMGHMFGIRHCIHYECNMNGANHLDEADATPMNLCPVCLRKLHQAIRFDPVERYVGMLRFYTENGFEEEAAWTKRRIGAIEVAGK
jgi:archaemetzincin